MMRISSTLINKNISSPPIWIFIAGLASFAYDGTQEASTISALALLGSCAK